MAQPTPSAPLSLWSLSHLGWVFWGWQGAICCSPALQNLLPLAMSWKQRFNPGKGGWSSNKPNNKVLWGSALTFILGMEKKGVS